MLQEPHKDASLRFEEEETCVHASRPEPDAVAPLEEHDSASEGGDPEASSLAGSVRYFSRAPNKVLVGMHVDPNSQTQCSYALLPDRRKLISVWQMLR